MSDIKIQPSATGSATVTLTAPTTGTARTVTLPDATGTLLNSDASGNVGINTTSPNLTATDRTTLDINGTTSTAISNSVAGTNKFYIYTDSTGSNIKHSSGFLRLSTSGGIRLEVEQAGDVKLHAGDLLFGTAGKGVVLGATTNVDANTLDDYEEGTWTPVVKDDANNTSPSITHNYSTYTKIGRMVTLTTEISSISNSGLSTTGDVRVYGLPFAVTTFGIGAVNMENVDYKDSYTDTESVTTIAMATFVYFRVNRNNGGSQGLEGGDLNSGSSGFSFTVTYFV